MGQGREKRKAEMRKENTGKWKNKDDSRKDEKNNNKKANEQGENTEQNKW